MQGVVLMFQRLSPKAPDRVRTFPQQKGPSAGNLFVDTCPLEFFMAGFRQCSDLLSFTSLYFIHLVRFANMLDDAHIFADATWDFAKNSIIFANPRGRLNLASDVHKRCPQSNLIEPKVCRSPPLELPRRCPPV